MQRSADIEAVERLVCQIDADTNRRDSLQDLALLGAAGNAHALDRFLEVVDRLGLLRPPVARQLFDPNDQDDVCQDVMLALVGELPKFRGEAHVSTWLHRIATNAALGFVRRRARRNEVREQIPLTVSGRLSSMVADRADLRREVDRLPDPYRRTVILRDVEQLTYKEIAAELALNLNTVRSHIARGRALLADQFMPSAMAEAAGETND